MTAKSIDITPEDNSVVALDSSGDAKTAKTATPNSTPRAPAPVAQKRGVVRRMWGFIKVLLGLAVIAIVAGAIYFGLPELNSRVLNPLSDNTARLSAVSDDVAANQAAVAGLDGVVADMNAQIEALAAAEAVVPDRLSAIESDIAAGAETQAELDSRMTRIESAIDGHDRQITSLEELQATLEANAATAGVEVTSQLTMLRTMELLSRARLFLYQANYGLAEQDVVAARDLYADSGLDAEVVLRLDRVIEALPERPVAAADDLDIAWQLLLNPVTPDATTDTTTAP